MAAPDQRQGSGSGSLTAPVSFTLKDGGVLDCPICSDPLSSPVYQCKNWHLACASCCASVKKECPFCSCPIGSIRCRAVEKIIESITLDCQNKVYGCDQKMSYAEKLTHLKSCKYRPCCCPLSSCDFVGSSKSLYEHFSASHAADCSFSFGSRFELTLDDSQEHAFLQETSKKVVFVLTRSSKPYASLVKIFCIASPSESAGTYHIELMAFCDGRTGISLFGPVECLPRWTAQLPTRSYLMVPNDFLCPNGQLHLDLILISNR